jgi:hypothetical protein
MTAIPFDTLKFARKLREAGFAAEQAEKTAEAQPEAMDGAKLATKADLMALRNDLKAEMREMELRMTIKFGAMQLAGTGLLLAALKYVGS